jgi:hypothetical protein
VDFLLIIPVRNELQWRWIWGSIDDGSCCAESVPDDDAFPYGRFRSRNIKNDYAAERHVTDGKTKWIYI